MDTPEGSSGSTFTYLPIVFEDDSQVRRTHSSFVDSADTFYEIEIEFLANEVEPVPFPSSFPIA